MHRTIAARISQAASPMCGALCLVAVLALAAGSHLAHAAAPAAGKPAAALELRPNWKAGVHVDYVVTKTKAHAGEPAKGSDTDLGIDVLAATPDGYRIAWTYGETRFLDAQDRANPIAVQMASLMKGVRFVVHLDRSAHVLEIENWQEVRDAEKKRFADILAVMKKAGIAAPVIDAASAQVAEMASSEEKVRQYGLQEAALLFFPLGRTYEPSTIQREEVRMPSLIGGEPISAQRSVTLKSHDRTSGKAVVAVLQKPDPDALSQAVDRQVKSVAARLGKPEPAAGELPRLRIEDAGEFTIDVATGWVSSALQTRTIDSGSRREVQTTSLRRKS